MSGVNQRGATRRMTRGELRESYDGETTLTASSMMMFRMIIGTLVFGHDTRNITRSTAGGGANSKVRLSHSHYIVAEPVQLKFKLLVSFTQHHDCAMSMTDLFVPDLLQQSQAWTHAV